jgi:phosphate transport system protein
MQETRHRFRQELVDLERVLLAEGQDAATAVERSVQALVHRDADLASLVVAGDDAIDARYLEIEARILEVLALQTPVASDLRLVFAILHTNLHIERIGDQAVNVAKMAVAGADLPREESILAHLEEMGDIVTRMVRVALDAFSRRDLALCLELPAMDDPVDVLNRNMYRKVVALGGGDQAALEWGIRMNVVSRQLERVGDNAVDIGEQVGFLLTGEFREFTDASDPDDR